LTFEVSQTEAQVGDTIVVTATFENLSGRRLRVQGHSPPITNLRQMISIAVISENCDRLDWWFFAVAGPIRRVTLRRGAIIEVRKEFIAREEGNFIAYAMSSFSIGRATHTDRIRNEERRVRIGRVSEDVRIKIQGENNNEN